MSLSIEQAVLGQLLKDNTAIYSMPRGVSSDVFTSAQHAALWAEITALVSTGQAADAYVLGTKRAGARTFDTVWLQELTSLAAGRNLTQYTQILVDAYRSRQFAKAIAAAHQKVTQGVKPSQVEQELHEQLEAASMAEGPDSYTSAQAITGAKHLIDGIKSGGDSGLLKTGFQKLDEDVRIQPGNLVIVGALTGVGKTTFAQNIAENVAMAGGAVLFHSFEMNPAEHGLRALSRHARISTKKLLDRAPLAADEKQRYEKAATLVEKLPLHWNTENDGLADVTAITRKLHRQHDLKLVIVDYLQLVRASARDNREQEVAAVTRTLKRLAMTLKVPVLALAQLNREATKRDGPPRLSDLRESGSIEMDANAVLFLHHPASFGAATNPRLFQIVAAKQRMGRSGIVVELEGQSEFSNFKDWSGQ